VGRKAGRLDDLVIVIKFITENVNVAPHTKWLQARIVIAGLATSRSGGRDHLVASMMTNKDLETAKPQLSEQDARLLLTMSADLVALCAKLIESFDPTAAAMLLYVRDEMAPDQKFDPC
jgi:hypothetical protein